jgi:hypothetical protein
VTKLSHLVKIVVMAAQISPRINFGTIVVAGGGRGQ